MKRYTERSVRDIHDRPALCLCASVAVLFSAPLWLGCGKRPLPPPAVAETPPSLPPLPELALLFDKELDLDPPPAAERPDRPSLLWDLGPPARHAYRIDQQIVNRSTSSDKSGEDRLLSTLAGDGTIEIAGRSAHYRMTLRHYTVNGRPQDVNRQPRAQIEYELDENGSVRRSRRRSGGDAQTLEVLFPLVPGTRAHERTGSYRETGSVTTTVTGFVLLRGRACARLLTQTLIDLAPPELDGSGIGKMRGRTVAYFDVEGRRFIQSDAAVSFVWHSRQMVTPPGGASAWTVGTLESHTLLRARLD